MKTYAYRIVNVFIRGGALTGNPLAVFEDGRGLDDATMQALALQMNLSETTFILPSDNATARVRIFTPCLRDAVRRPSDARHRARGALAALGRRFAAPRDEGRRDPGAGEGRPLDAAGQQAKWREITESKAELAAMLGLEAADIAERPLWVGRPARSTHGAGARCRCRGAREAEGRRFTRLKSVDNLSMAYVFADAGDAKGR
jgi:hypothetical protein